jgi:hypothetical protein
MILYWLRIEVRKDLNAPLPSRQDFTEISEPEMIITNHANIAHGAIRQDASLRARRACGIMFLAGATLHESPDFYRVMKNPPDCTSSVFFTARGMFRKFWVERRQRGNLACDETENRSHRARIQAGGGDLNLRRRRGIFVETLFQASPSPHCGRR